MKEYRQWLRDQACTQSITYRQYSLTLSTDVGSIPPEISLGDGKIGIEYPCQTGALILPFPYFKQFCALVYISLRHVHSRTQVNGRITLVQKLISKMLQARDLDIYHSQYPISKRFSAYMCSGANRRAALAGKERERRCSCMKREAYTLSNRTQVDSNSSIRLACSPCQVRGPMMERYKFCTF